MTMREAFDAGYVRGDLRLQLGYVSRKVNGYDQEVQTAGGYRHGELYVLLPNFRSTRYCYRQYLVKADV